LEPVVRLLVAVALAAAIGFERELADKPAGLRTHVLVAFGAALFTITSANFAGTSDPSRIAAGVVAGVGFLGAGAIFRGEQGLMHGLTTAASIWAVAAVGLAAGAGLYLLATVATIIGLIVLRLPSHTFRG
jgi:putative Mg2+ transporter-C (MgtC) family protein